MKKCITEVQDRQNFDMVHAICNLHSCNNFAFLLMKNVLFFRQSEVCNVFMHITMITTRYCQASQDISFTIYHGLYNKLKYLINNEILIGSYLSSTEDGYINCITINKNLLFLIR